MRVAVHHSVTIARKLHETLEPCCLVEEYVSRQELGQALRSRPVDALMLEPASFFEIWPVIARFRSLPLILYSDLDRSSVRTILGINRVRTPLLVIRDLEDAPLRVHRFLQSLPLAQLNQLVLDRLAEPLTALPAELMTTIALHFAQAEPGRTVQWLAATAGLCRRTVERWIVRGGLTSARLIAIAPSITRAYCYLRDPGYTVGDVASKTGVSSRHTLLEEMHAFTGMRSISAVRELGPDRFVEAVVGALLGVQRRAATAHAGQMVGERIASRIERP